MAGSGTSRSAPGEVIRGALGDLDLVWEEPSRDHFVVTLPGERKQKTSCALEVGAHAVGIHAFVARNPEENHEAVYRFLLERNRKLYAVAFCVDHLGDIHLAGKLPLQAVTPDEVDRVLGSVLEAADTSFNQILELGFASAIRREWAWRTSRGEPTGNLEAFHRLVDDP